LSVPSSRGLSRVDLSGSSPTLGMHAPKTSSFPPTCFIAAKAPFTAEPMHDSFAFVSRKSCGRASSRAMTDDSHSWMGTRTSSGRGTKMSSRSETTNICGWLRFAFRL